MKNESRMNLTPADEEARSKNETFKNKIFYFAFESTRETHVNTM